MARPGAGRDNRRANVAVASRGEEVRWRRTSQELPRSVRQRDDRHRVSCRSIDIALHHTGSAGRLGRGEPRTSPPAALGGAMVTQPIASKGGARKGADNGRRAAGAAVFGREGPLRRGQRQRRAEGKDIRELCRGHVPALGWTRRPGWQDGQMHIWHFRSVVVVWLAARSIFRATLPIRATARHGTPHGPGGSPSGRQARSASSGRKQAFRRRPRFVPSYNGPATSCLCPPLRRPPPAAWPGQIPSLLSSALLRAIRP